MIFIKETWILESKKLAEPVHLSLTKNLILYLGRQIKRGLSLSDQRSVINEEFSPSVEENSEMRGTHFFFLAAASASSAAAFSEADLA